MKESYNETLQYLQNYNPEDVLESIKRDVIEASRKIEVFEIDLMEISEHSVGDKKYQKRKGFITKATTVLVLSTLLFNLSGCKDNKKVEDSYITSEFSLADFEKELYNEAYSKGRNAGNIILAEKVNEFNAGINPDETINEDIVCEIDKWIGKEGWEFQFDINPSFVDDSLKYKCFVANAIYDALVDSVNGFVLLPNTLEEFCSQLGILNCVVVYDESTKQLEYMPKDEKVTDNELLNNLHILAYYYNLKNENIRIRN